MENNVDSIVAKTYYSLIIVGTIIIFSTIGTSSVGSVTGTIIGYSFIIVGLLIISGVSLSKMGSHGNFNIISFLMTSGPFLLTIAILSYLLYLLSIYFKQITDGNVSKGYYTFSNIIIILIIAQLIIFSYGSQEKHFKTTYSLSKVYGMTLYLLGVITLFTVFTLGTILKYFTTDG